MIETSRLNLRNFEITDTENCYNNWGQEISLGKYIAFYPMMDIQEMESFICAVRNAGVNAASGKIIVTIDADSIMSKYSLCEIKDRLESGKYIGGGSPMRFDRMSVGILCSAAAVAINLIPVMIKNKAALSGGMFWFYKQTFIDVGGFDETLISLEDMDFASRLNALGKSCNKKFGSLKHSYIITSSRKFDEFGDFYLIKNMKMTKRIFTGRDREAADKFYYDVR